ncbi:recombinase family protein [Micromonospora sp. GCM10011541]|uniref:recombinase family protein n=1 Tax=Micromonospora sp. GCM10011541 TaxID=3317336 RepID=UPI00361F713E
MQSLKGKVVAIYLRISDDKEEEGKGVRRQAKDSIYYALSRGAATIVIYEENDTGAFKKKRLVKTASDGFRYYVWRVVRPVWDRQLADLRANVAQAVVTYDIDRLARDNRDLEDAIELAEYMGKLFMGVTGSLDLLTDSGRAMARVLVAMANKSSADTARRVAREHLARAEAGEPAGGRRPFGWTEDKRTLDPVESEHIKDAVASMLAGVTPSAVMADWLKRGILTPRGNPWTWAPFHSMMRNPRICGWRGKLETINLPDGRIRQVWQIVKKADGTEVKGKWEPIVSRDDWEKLRATIGEGHAPKDTPAGEARAKHLLSGLVLCGRCAHTPRMVGVETKSKGRNGLPRITRFYQCLGATARGCGRNSRAMDPLDDLIRDTVFEVHDKRGGVVPEIEEEPSPDPHADRINEIEELLAEAYDAWKGKLLPSADYFKIRADLTAEKEELEEEQSDALLLGGPSLNTRVDVRGTWDERTNAERRAFLSHYLQAVIIHPIEKVWDERKKKDIHPLRFNPDLIEPVWR